MLNKYRTLALLGASVLAFAAAGLPAVAQNKQASQTRLASNPPAESQPSAAQLAGSVANNGDGIAAIVNDTPISNYDLQQRMALFLATSGVRPNADQLKSIREQVLKQLETERIELLEAQKNNTTISTVDVDKAIGNIVSDNHLTLDQLKKMLVQSGVDMATLRSQISTQLAWSKTVQDQYGDSVHISPEEVGEELARIKNGANKPRFHVGEIFEAVDTPEQNAKVLKDVTDLYNQIELGAPFSAVARQFSQNPTAAQGGDLGWVQEGQLPSELDAALKTMRPGDVSQPIRSSGGYYILQYRDRQEPAGTKLPDAAQLTANPSGALPLARVLLPIGPKPAKDLTDRAMQVAAMLRSHIAGCEHLQQVAAKIPGAQYFNLGTMRLTDLSPEIQGALSKTEAGDSTVPFSSSAGVEIIVRCDKPVPRLTEQTIPTRDQVEQELYEGQMSVLARRYLRDLRRDADVETR
ncbi:MAG TPA: peptidylprolyl isomerase [Rhizomicrobium sp.]